MTTETKPIEVEILEEDLNLDIYITAQETEELYLGDDCYGKALNFEH